MANQLRLLHLEDNPTDSDLILAMLTEAGIDCTAQRVETRDAFIAALKHGQVDMVLADYSLPGFDGSAALELSQQLAPDIPFLFVSGTLGEELAIDCMHRGATDYILKQRLGRLTPSVQRALREMDVRADRARAEEALRQSELQLRQSQKMEAVGRLAGGLAHDFNNLLTVIMGQSQVLLYEMEDGHPQRGKIEEMRQAGERAATLIKQLLTFSRKQPSEPKVVNLNTILTSMESMLVRLIGEDIELTVKPSSGALRVKADPSQIEQVIMNLVVNARDAMPSGGKLLVETSYAILDHTPMHHLKSLGPGVYVRLSVSDTGCGMPAPIQAHIFEPFFTTKEEGKGTGLGLSTVFGIVTQSGGGLDVTSIVGKGTWFDVYLPSVVSETDRDLACQTVCSATEGHENILLVEDDNVVRELIRVELGKLGYRVLTAPNGLEACLIGTRQIEELDLLLTDVVMPGMNGIELAEHLRMIKPELKLLFISGYTDEAGIKVDGSVRSYFPKPFTPDTLARAVRDILDFKQMPTSN